MIYESLCSLRKEKINDLIITGITDPSEAEMQFLPDFTLLYIETGGKHIVFESVEQYAKLKITIADTITYHKVDDPDFQYINMSLMNLLLINGAYASTIIDTLSFYRAEIGNDYILCDLAVIRFSSNQSFIIDPLNFWGITLAGLINDAPDCDINEKYSDILSEYPDLIIPGE